MFEFDT